MFFRIHLQAGAFILAAMLLFVYGASASDVTMETLLGEMCDLERLTVAPSPGYVTRQFSSYDRNSTDPAIPTEHNWFANYDRNQHLRVEENNGSKEYVLMDAAGPGAIVRFWSANPNEGGTVRFYLDHDKTPAIEMVLQDFLSGAGAPFIKPFSGERGKGWNCYFPIPYARHCKVTISEGDIYYIINYRTYEADAIVTTFTKDDARKFLPKIQEVASILSHPQNALDKAAGEANEFDVSLAPRASETLELSGPGAICRITAKIEAEDLESALRQCIVKIAFDGHPASVVAPLGDFFGSAPGLNPYHSLPSGVLADGTMYSHWVMPYKEQAVISVHNHADFEVQLSGIVLVRERVWTDDTLYFHANWRSEKDIPTRPFQDWNYLTATGSGRFCGVMLHIANPVVQWWGEGDEKVYVDGETFPSWFGTGTEDYFGYAWCDTALFTHAYHNQVRCDGPGNLGHTCVSRFHIMDNIPFDSSLKFDLEIWHWADTRITQAITAYWYGAPGAQDNFPAIDPDLLVIPVLPGPPRVEGALEGEKMRIVSVTDGTADPQSGSWPWSRGAQMWWRHASPGDRLVLGFEVEKAGTCEVRAVFTKAPDYGIHQLYINGKKCGEPMDFYHPEVIADEERSLGLFELKAGENLFEVEVTGSRPEAIPAHMFGLDYLRLVH